MSKSIMVYTGKKKFMKNDVLVVSVEEFIFNFDEFLG